MSHRLEISVAKASWDSQSPEKEQTLPYIFTRQSERSHGSRKRSTNTHIENFDSQPNNGLNSNSIALFDTMHSSSSNSSKHEETSLVFPMLRTTSWLLKSLSMKKSRKKINGGITQRIQNSSGPKFNKSDLAYLSANSSSITDGCQGIQVKSSDSSPITTNTSSCNCSDPRIGLYLVNGKETLDRINVFLDNLDDLCDEAEKYLVKTIPQRLTDYVFSTGSKNKASDLKEATDILRKGLELINNLGKEDLNSQSGSLAFPFVDVIHSKKHSTSLITGLDWDSTYILPSAHFPLLIGVTVNQYASSYKPSKLASTSKFESQTTDRFVRIKVKFERLTRDHAVTSLQSFVQNDYFLKSPGKSHKDIEAAKDSRLEYQYVFRGALGGEVRQTKLSNNNHHGKLQYCSQDGASPVFSFETSGSTSRTLKLHLYEFTVIHEESQKKRYASHTIDDTGKSSYSRFVGECFLDLRGVLDYQAANIEQDSHSRTFIYHTRIFSHNNMRFDCEGNLEGGSPSKTPSFFELETAITIAPLPNKQVANAVTRPITRHLLYKHGDDLRQEMLALQFMREVDCILKASGLDMKMRTFGCCPVASNRGFIEWMPSCVPLSKICDMSLYKSANDIVVELQEDENVNAFESVNLKSDYFMEMAASFGSSTGLTGSSIPSTKEKEQEPEEAEFKGWLKHQFMTRPVSGPSSRDLASHINPIQDFLRSAAHDDSCPFYIDKTVMDNYVKSCAGWCVATYLLGVGDRHLDNILLNADTGQLIHCDFSFILGCDPKTYIPIRLSAEMVTGMGGRESTNYAKFLSLLGAAFNILRRPSNFRALCSLLRLATFSSMPDLCSNQTPEAAMSALIGRFRLDLSDDEAITYLEELVESCLENKLWLAVDAMHSIGKHF